MWQRAKSLLVVALLATAPFTSAASEWPQSTVFPLESAQELFSSSFTPMSAVSDPFDTVPLEVSEQRMHILLGATGGGEPHGSLACKDSKHKISLLTGESVRYNVENLHLQGEAEGLVHVTLGMSESPGAFSLGSTGGLTLDAGAFTDSQMASFSGSLADVRTALASLVFVVNKEVEGKSTLHVSISGFGLESSECRLKFEVSRDRLPDALKARVTLKGYPKDLAIGGAHGAMAGELSSVSGFAASRFASDRVDDLIEHAVAYFTISPQQIVTLSTGDGMKLMDFKSERDATPRDIYKHLRKMKSSEFQSTTYLRWVDTNSWQEQCSNGDWLADCSHTALLTGWRLWVLVAGGAVAFILLIVGLVFAVRRCHRNKEASLEAKAIQKDKDLALAAAGGPAAAKQFIYSAPSELGAEFSSTDPKSINFVSEVAIQEKSSSIDPMRATGAADDELLAEPVLVGEDEKAAAELAKNRLDASRAENSAHSRSGQTRFSTTGGSTGSTRHFFYVDESKMDLSNTNSNTSILAQREESRRNSLGSAAHFKYTDDAHEPASLSRSAASVPALPMPPSTPVSKQKDAFQSQSTLEFQTSDASHRSRATTKNESAPGSSRESSASAKSSSVSFVVAGTATPEGSTKKKAPLKVVKPNTPGDNGEQPTAQAN